MSLTLASQVIGFISFSITLATLLGVYSDLLRSLRGAPTTIPLALGNLREELQYEQLYLRQKQKFQDRYEVFPESQGKARRRRHEFASLIEQTLQHLWREFVELERPFIVSGETPFILTMEDDDNEMHHVFSYDEKLPPSRRRRSARQPSRRDSYRRNRFGVIEAGLSADRSTYYRTDIAARVLWWYKSNDIQNLAQQIQRIQLRRTERDVYEANELIKRSYRMHCKLNGWSMRGDDSIDSDSDGAGGGPGSDDGGDPRHPPRPGMGHSVRVRRSHRKRRSNGDGSLGPAEHISTKKEIVRRRPPVDDEELSPPRSRPTTRQSSRPPRGGSVVYEYEVVDPGRIYVDVADPRNETRRPRSRPRSYSRERE